MNKSPDNHTRPPNLVFIDTSRPAVDETREVQASLGDQRPSLSPKFFYDSRGSELFEAITELPEYYLTRAEAEIFEQQLEDIITTLGPVDVVIEPGGGSCSKVRGLLKPMQPRAFVAIDIAGDFLQQAASEVARDWPELEVTAIAADFTRSWDFTDALPVGRRLVFYPGSTLGNFDPEAQASFLGQLASVAGSDGGILLGVDLHKDSNVLHAAYNDASGLTAAFNRNMLNVVNARTGADFRPDEWQHEARYNPTRRRIEMDLVASSRQAVAVGGREFIFGSGDAIRTEHSCKFTLDDLQQLAASAQMVLSHHWLDSRGLFCLALLEPA